MSKTPENKIISWQGDLFEPEETTWYSGYKRLAKPPSKPGTPTFSWHGPKMSVAEWRQAVRFLLRVNHETKSEAQLRAFIIGDEIKCWAFPQKKGSGMTTKEISGPDKDAQMNQLLDQGATQIMTIHSHCNMSAFQSGTDEKDESTVDGLHITIGKLSTWGQDKLSDHFHSRIYFDGIKYDGTELAAWFDLGWSKNMKNELMKLFGGHTSTLTALALVSEISEAEYMAADAFPKQWWDNLIEEPVTTAMVPYSAVNYRTHSEFGRWKAWQAIRRGTGTGLSLVEKGSIMSIAAHVFGQWCTYGIERLLDTLKKKGGPTKVDVYREEFYEFTRGLAKYGYTNHDAIMTLTEEAAKLPKAVSSTIFPHTGLQTAQGEGWPTTELELESWRSQGYV